MAENLEIVNEALEFSNEAVQIIKDSFGPNGLDTLVSTTSGTLMLTNDGYQIMKSLSQRNPVGKLIFQGLNLFYKSTGDFSKKFILLIRELLAEVLDIVSLDKTASSEQLLCIAQGMDELFCSVIPQVFDDLQTVRVISECSDVRNSAISIIKFSISGKFSPKTTQTFVSLLQQLFLDEFSNDIANLKQTTEALLDDYSSTVWEVAGKPVTSSVVLSGIIIPRHFLTIVKNLPCSMERNLFKFVILGSSFGHDVPQSNTVLTLNESQHVENVLKWRHKHVENVVKMLANHSVELVLTSVMLHETFVHVFNQYQMAAIHLIPLEDIERIGKVFGIIPLHELEEDMTLFIGEATSCKPIQIGQHQYAHLEPAKTLVKQIVLYAPTEALCHQYSIALQHMLKILCSSFKQPQKDCFVLSFVPGGGGFELALAHAIEENRKLNKLNTNTQLACKILEKALLCIPRELATNSNSNLSIFHLKAKTREMLINREQVNGLNQKGELALIKNEEIIEPTMANYMLLSSVLQLFVQVLRTDKIIYVKKLNTLPNMIGQADDDDSDNELDE